MDLSKLPKLSGETPDPPPERSQSLSANSLPVVALPVVALPVRGSLIDAWIGVGVGLFLLMVQPRFLQWASSRLFHTAFADFLDPAGNVVPYQTLPEFWMDLGPTLFGLILIVDGFLLFTRRRFLLWITLALTALGTSFNLIWVVVSYSPHGLAPLSFIAVIVGGYLLSVQWARLTAEHANANSLEGKRR